MAHGQPILPPDDPRAGYLPSPEPAARERAMRQVDGTLMDIEQLQARTERARRVAAECPGCDDIAEALAQTVERLKVARTELRRSALFNAGDEPKLF